MRKIELWRSEDCRWRRVLVDTVSYVYKPNDAGLWRAQVMRPLMLPWSHFDGDSEQTMATGCSSYANERAAYHSTRWYPLQMCEFPDIHHGLVSTAIRSKLHGLRTWCAYDYWRTCLLPPLRSLYLITTKMSPCIPTCMPPQRVLLLCITSTTNNGRQDCYCTLSI